VHVDRVLLVSANPGKRIVAWLEEHPVALVVATRDVRRKRLDPELYGQIARSGLTPLLTLDFSVPTDSRRLASRQLPTGWRRPHCLRLRQSRRV
jgi:hypothetical protein